MTSGKNTRDEAIDRAMQAARARDGGGIIRALEGVELQTSPGVSLDEKYLAAERAYHLGDYPSAVSSFQAFERDRKSGTAPAWQRYLSAHRRSWILLYQGDLVAAERALSEAQHRIKATADLSKFEADLEAIEGHLFEAAGEYEQARGRFLRAFEHAQEHGHWPLAMSTALDHATLLGHLGRPADASDWLRKAREALPKAHHDRGAERVIKLRSARISTQLNDYEQAKASLDELVHDSREAENPSTLIDALIARADIARAHHDFSSGEADLQRAIRLCDQMGIRATRVLALLDLTKVFLERGNEGDLDQARGTFGRAVRQALLLRPLQSRLVERLGDDLLKHSNLTALSMNPQFRRDLGQAVTALKELARPRIIQQAERLQERQEAQAILASLLERFRAGEIRLLHSKVYPLAREVVFPARKSEPITEAELQTLQVLVAAPYPGVTIKELAAELGIDREAAKKRLKRLRDAIAEDLVGRRRGGSSVYSVRRAPPQEHPPLGIQDT